MIVIKQPLNSLSIIMSKQAKCHGLATQHFNMVTPQKTRQDSESNQENWHVVKSKKI